MGTSGEVVLTVAATRTEELDIGQLVLMGYRRAGLLNEHQEANAAKLNHGKMVLETIIKELQIYGIYAREVVLETVAIVTGTKTYSLASTTLDVLATAVHIDGTDDIDNPTSALVMKMVDREQRQTISNESATGSPTMFYVDRTTVPLSVWIWPAPSSNGWVRFQSHRLAADNLDTTKTVDLERYWAQYIIWELGHQLAVDNSMLERGAYCATIAAQKLTMCRAYSNPRGSFQIQMDHSTPWSR